MADSGTHSISSGAASQPPKRPSFVATSVGHPRLACLDTESIRIFLGEYDAYCKEVTAQAQQLLPLHTTTFEPVRPVSLKFWIEIDQLESVIDLGFIPNVSDFGELSDTALCNLLDGKIDEDKTITTVLDIDTLVVKEICMNMSVKSAWSRMELLFMSYSTLLRRHGLE